MQLLQESHAETASDTGERGIGYTYCQVFGPDNIIDSVRIGPCAPINLVCVT